jgi:hypothetical protein
MAATIMLPVLSVLNTRPWCNGAVSGPGRKSRYAVCWEDSLLLPAENIGIPRKNTNAGYHHIHQVIRFGLGDENLVAAGG